MIAGVATGTGVESTARQAYEAGFNVTLAVDAMTDARPEAHDYSIANVFPRLGETGSTQEIIDLLERTHGMNWLDLVVLFFRRRLPHQRRSPLSSAGMMGRAVPEPVRKAAGRGAVVIDRQHALGLLQSRRRISAGLPRRRFRFEEHTATSPRSGLGGLLIGLFLARHFGRLHGGNQPGANMSIGVHFDRYGDSTTGSGRPARLCPTSAPGCSATAQDWLVFTQLTHHAHPPSAW